MADASARTVLVVEDDELTRRAYIRLIEAIGNVRVLAAPNLATARQMVAEQSPSFAIVDRLLPDGDGIDLIAELCPVDRGMRAVLVSGNNETDTTVRAIRAGAEDVVDKPLRAEKLKELLLGAAPARSEGQPMHSAAWTRWHQIRDAVRECNGNKSEAARRLGIDRNTLHSWYRKPQPLW